MNKPRRLAYGPLRAAWRSMPRWRWPWLVLIVLCLLITPVVIYNPTGWQKQHEYQQLGHGFELHTRGHFTAGKALKIKIRSSQPVPGPLDLLINNQKALRLQFNQSEESWQAQGRVKLPDMAKGLVQFAIVNAEKKSPTVLSRWDFKQPLPPNP